MTDDEQGYNGWSNYETWCVNLWLTKNQYDYNHYLEQAKILYKNDNGWKEMQGDIARYIKKEINYKVNLKNGLYKDLLQSAIDNVNFREIAKHFIEQAKKT